MWWSLNTGGYMFESLKKRIQAQNQFLPKKLTRFSKYLKERETLTLFPIIL
jgi:hypothetical protein